MRPWTTRTLHVALLAAGVAALGSATASAAELPGGTPDVAGAPSQIGGALPLALCQPPVPVQGQHTLPCADTNLGMQAPNLAKKGATTIAGTAAGVGGQLADGKPITEPQRVPALAGVAAHQLNQLAALNRQRPDTSLGLAPGNTGVIDKGTLLDGTVRPHQPGEPGFSAADTQANLDAVQGETLKPISSPDRAVSELTGTPQTLASNVAGGGNLPVATDLPGQAVVAQVQQQVEQGAQQLPGTSGFGQVQGLLTQKGVDKSAGLPQLPLGQNNTTGLPATGTPVDQVVGQVTSLTNEAGKHRAMEPVGRHRAATPRNTGPLDQVPVVGQLAGQLNTPLAGGNPLSAVGAPVNTSNSALPGITNPTQALGDPTQALSNPTQALGNPTQALGNAGQVAQMVTGLVTGVAGSH